MNTIISHTRMIRVQSKKEEGLICNTHLESHIVLQKFKRLCLIGICTNRISIATKLCLKFTRSSWVKNFSSLKM